MQMLKFLHGTITANKGTFILKCATPNNCTLYKTNWDLV